MKKLVLGLFLLPLGALAQPTITNAENHVIGTTFQQVVCDSVPPGPSGASQTWNFAALNSQGDTAKTYNIAPVTGNPFTGANLCQYSPADMSYTHFIQTSPETVMLGMLDSSGNNGSQFYTNGMLMMRRPITYGDTATDSFAYTASYGGFPYTAKGALSAEADGYGTLVLPTGTYNNVLRLRIESHEQDSTLAGFVYVDNVYYVWYDNAHRAPLMRVDSIVISGLANATFVDTRFLLLEAPVTSTPNVEVTKASYNASLHANELLLKGTLEQNKQYDVALIGMNGQKVFNSNFIAKGAEQRFTVGDISAGTYMLTIMKKGDFSSFTTVKIVK